MIEKINQEIQDCPDTIFDTFNLSIDLKLCGAALRSELVSLSNMYGRINQLSSNAYFRLEQARKRLEEVTAIAWAQFDENIKITEKKIRVKNFEIIYKGETTSINKEENKVIIYEYIAERGKNKTKEISSLLDVGRTLLSWDKNEYSRTKIYE